MKKKTLICLLLTLTLVTASCGNTSVGNETTTNDPVTTEPEVTTEAEILPDLPSGLRFDGTTIRLFESTEQLISGQNEGEVVSEAIYYRTMAVEDQLGVKFESITRHYAEIAGVVRNSVNSGSDDYDLVFTAASYVVPLVNSGLYMQVSELPYIDLDKPWWNRSYIESVSLNSENASILFGDICYNSIERIVGVMFNKRLLSEIKGMEDNDLYKLVLDGKWTLDKYGEISKGVYRDVNGNGERDNEDIYATVQVGCSAFNWMAYSSGLRFTERDSEGYPVLKMNSERTVDLVDKLISLFVGNEDTFEFSDNHEHTQKFGNGESLFLVNRLYTCGWDELRMMNNDFGIIPTPKLDESIEEYHSVVGELVVWGGVPITATNLDAISAAAELLAYEGKKRVTPVYYETALKIKYARDDMSSQMIDIITSGARTDFLFMNHLGDLGMIFQNIYENGENTFSSLYASYEKPALASLESLKAELAKNS